MPGLHHQGSEHIGVARGLVGILLGDALVLAQREIELRELRQESRAFRSDDLDRVRAGHADLGAERIDIAFHADENDAGHAHFRRLAGRLEHTLVARFRQNDRLLQPLCVGENLL